MVEHGDFTRLADDYARFRPGYSGFVLDALLGLCGKAPEALSVADVGAGTGIWTRMLASKGCDVTAVEPNDEMRSRGEGLNGSLSIKWMAGSGEETGLASGSLDMVTMASSFHWTDLDRSTAEFSRVLRPGGIFCALWNTRLVELNPLLKAIEDKAREMAPQMKRVSSGRSAFCADLTDKLLKSPHFENALYMEGRHIEDMTPERYMGIWRSVNDMRVQMGEVTFKRFLAFVEKSIARQDVIQAAYLTRAWVGKTAARV